MFILHGQLGFENSNTSNSEGRIEYVQCTLSHRFRQITKARIMEANYKSHVHYTCYHDLESDHQEHVPITEVTQRVLLDDPMDPVVPSFFA